MYSCICIYVIFFHSLFLLFFLIAHNELSLMDLVQKIEGKQSSKSPFQSTNKQPLTKRPMIIQRSIDNDNTKSVRTESSGLITSSPHSKYKTTSTYTSAPTSTTVTSSSSSTHDSVSPTHINSPPSYNITTTPNHRSVSSIPQTAAHSTSTPSASIPSTSVPSTSISMPSFSSSSTSIIGHKQDTISNRPSIWQGSIQKKAKPYIEVKLELVYDPWKLANDAK